MNDKELTYTYALTEDDYLEYNLAIASKTMKGARKKMELLGILEILIAIAVGVTFIVTKESSAFMIILDILLVLFGLNSLCYYRLIFPRKLRKAVKSTITKSAETVAERTVTVNSQGVREVGGDKDNFIAYSEMIGVYITKTHILFMLDKIRAIVIPLKAVQNFDELNAKIDKACEENENLVKERL